MASENEDLTGVFEVDKTETGGSVYPTETEFVRIEYDADGYYMVHALDEDKNKINDGKFDAHRPEARIEGAFNSDSEGKFSILV